MMTPERDEPIMTAEEYATLPDEPRYRTELSYGQVVREPRPGAVHGVLTDELYARIQAHVRAHGLGRTLIETGFQLPGEAHTVRGPDIAYVSTARLPQHTPPGYWQFAPDLAVEIRSPTDRWPVLYGKVEDYLAAGSRAVWVVDPTQRTVTVHAMNAAPAITGVGGTLRGGDVLPHFELNVDELFAAL